MRIGIDVDDTLNNVHKRLARAANKYAKSFGKFYYNKKFREFYSDGSDWKENFNFTYPELKYFFGCHSREHHQKSTNATWCKKICSKIEENGV